MYLLVRRDGTVVGGSAPSDPDPLRATLTAARTCDRVTAISFRRAGRRPGVPLVEAGASLDGWAEVPRELQQRIAEGLRGRVIRPLFAVGLRASALRGRTTDSVLRQELEGIVATLDEVIANLRRAVLHPPPTRHDGPNGMSDRDFDTNARVVSELHAVGITVQRLYRRSDDPSVQEQLLRIVDRLGDAVSELRSAFFERPERRPRPGAADAWLAGSSPVVHPESGRQPGGMPVDPDDLTRDA